MKDLDYSTMDTPENYKCAHCGASGCKLWMEYVMCCPQLLCVDCACKDQAKTNNVDHEGLRTDSDGHRTDIIGWYIPAVPNQENTAYWAYSHVPDAGADWWNRLPLRSPARS